ncbi:MAG TPA: hypothetical protein PLK80_11635 [bacterium]|nr:MAG: hypothetical protein BWY28_00929 [bacterium ADurb.Bin236]HPI77373.1 hypothetical protein [bacterium]HPN95852.1 hypothetical protein [bacterium]
MREIGSALIAGTMDFRRMALTDELREAGWRAQSTSKLSIALKLLNERGFDCVLALSDGRPEKQAEFIRRVNELHPDVFVITVGCDSEADAENDNLQIFECLEAPSATQAMEAMNRGMLLKSARERLRGIRFSGVSAAS